MEGVPTSKGGNEAPWGGNHGSETLAPPRGMRWTWAEAGQGGGGSTLLPPPRFRWRKGSNQKKSAGWIPTDSWAGAPPLPHLSWSRPTQKLLACLGQQAWLIPPLTYSSDPSTLHGLMEIENVGQCCGVSFRGGAGSSPNCKVVVQKKFASLTRHIVCLKTILDAFHIFLHLQRNQSKKMPNK